MNLSQLLARWKTDSRFLANVAEWRELPAAAAVYVPWPAGLEPRVISAYRAQGIEQPFCHQAEAIEAALAGRHVVLVTPTASGKTMGYNAPILHTLLQNPQACALYLFPTKALAQDQWQTLQLLRLDSAPAMAVYDGDTPSASRRQIRENARLLITNPDMLHSGLLPYHPRWRRFFAQLRYIVIDELHTYRGVFGSHVANVLRRLRRICAFYGSSPQFLLTSATIANPEEQARLLLDLPSLPAPPDLAVIRRNGAPRAQKQMLFYNPPLIDKKMALRQSMLTAAHSLARDLLDAGAQTVIFARSRLTVEVLLSYLRDDAVSHSRPAEAIRGYRGGYLPSLRREIESGLREGSVRGVVATNALELGVDIGGLEAALLSGYPGSIASTWQQAGRAGRRVGESVAILVAGSEPLDQFLMSHPHYFFDQAPEHARLSPDNLVIVMEHLRCAAFELSFHEGEGFGRFPATNKALQALAAEGLLRHSGGQYYWTAAGYPAENVSLRSAGSENIVITLQEGNETRTLGEIDKASAPRLVYPGAIYLHEGRSYQITALDWEGGRAEAAPADVDFYTQAALDTEVETLRAIAEETQQLTSRSWGEVRVRSQAHYYRLIRRYSHETLGYGDIDLPAQEMDTTAYWLTLTEEALDCLRKARLWHFDDLDYGPDWPERREEILHRDNRMCRLCGASGVPGRPLAVHHLTPLRAFFMAARWISPAELYERANDPSNLLTVCPACHRRLETMQRLSNAWRGLAHALGNLAPLYLMADAHDIGLTYESRPAGSAYPAITIYDQAPGGLGFSEQLYDLHNELLSAALTLVRDCPCDSGCPVCVGPPLLPPIDEAPEAFPMAGDEATKAETIAMLELLCAPPHSAGTVEDHAEDPF